MRKLLLISITLLMLDVFLYRYLNLTMENKKPYLFIDSDIPLIYQTNDIELNKTNEFKFNNYFNIITFDTVSYRYEFKDDCLNIYLYPDLKYSFKYKTMKPEVIKETIYIEKEIPVEITNTVSEIDEYTIEEDYFYVDNDYLYFDIDTDFDYIRQVLSNNIHTSYQTNIDYAKLNSSQVGQYEVIYSCENKKIEIIVEIG